MEEPGVIYLDHAATTPLRPEAVEALRPFLDGRFGNPSGAHRLARTARRAVDDARDLIAATIDCRPGEVVFTSGGTESDNTAIAGAVTRHGGRPACAAAEHHAVLDAVARCAGAVVPVDRRGHVDLDALATVAAEPGVSVISVMAVNNEVGTISDLAAARDRVGPRMLLHTDAVQAAPWLDLRSIWPHVDVLSLSAHKFGGPQGVGVLVVRDGAVLAPLLVGGGQERERRSGTHNVAGIVATAAALAATDRDRAGDVVAVAARRDRLVADVRARIGGVHETVAPGDKVAGSAHLLIEGVESEALLYLLDRAGVCGSAASACGAGAMEPSHVLAAMGVAPELARGALRLTLGPTTTDAEVDGAVIALAAAVDQLRARTGRRSSECAGSPRGAPAHSGALPHSDGSTVGARE